MRVPWDAASWLASFRRASSAHDREGIRVRFDTHQDYHALHRGTHFHASTDPLIAPSERRGTYQTPISVVGADCLEVAHALVSTGEGPVVLNMASRRNPGGGVLGGAGAQEENPFRRSNLLWSLYQFAPYAGEYGVPSNPDGLSYPIPSESGGIYSPPSGRRPRATTRSPGARRTTPRGRARRTRGPSRT